MRIGELADLAGVTVRTIRHYHQLGVLPEAERLANGYRDYSVDHLVMLIRIRQLVRAGFSVTQAGKLLAAAPDDAADTALDAVDAALRQQIAELQEQRRRLSVFRSAPHPGLSKLAAALVTSPQDIPLSTIFAQLYADEEQGDRLAEVLQGPEVKRSIERTQRDFAAVDDATPDEVLETLATELERLSGVLNADLPDIGPERGRLLMGLAERGLNDRQRQFLRRISFER
ncbi:MerR family transcriptional regulator [Leucobacter sp. Psy1]|uniref:MerR family transcriptional regulator n=1 Tax=Leucobacter sp. Psy1 TaxID=2875729 RepID=UPI001CD5024B|nr:MerR family transcriptional regulator [Leucobacter sp. Psy1]